jgi:hypothetical protein
LQAYESFQSKVESGSEKADELNQRFAKWYYVISGESYDKLSLDRSAFVSTKAVEDVAPATEDTAPAPESDADAVTAEQEPAEEVSEEPANPESDTDEKTE